MFVSFLLFNKTLRVWGLLGVSMTLSLAAADFEIDAHGQVRCDAVTGGVKFFSDDWRATDLPQGLREVIRREEEGYRELSGRFLPRSREVEPFALGMAYQEDGLRRTLRWTLSAEALTAPIKARDFGFSFELPYSAFIGRTVLLDGKAVVLETPVQATGSASKIVLPGNRGFIELKGDFRYLLQDLGRYRTDAFQLRLSSSPGKGEFEKSSGSVEMRFRPYAGDMVDLRPAMNMGFADERGGDGAGGWTDQGPSRDLRAMVPGEYTFGGLPFDIVNPQENQGASVIVLRGTGGGLMPPGAEVAVKGKVWRNLFVLHTCAWTPNEPVPVGTIEVGYADGERGRIEIQLQRDVGNWWGPLSLPNGHVAWTEVNEIGSMGLYLSRFPVKPKPIEFLEFRSAENPMWLIVAVTGTAQDVPLPVTRDTPLVITESPEWKPIAHDPEVEADSALDFSFLVEAPAGKYGRVVARDGQYEFTDRPGHPVRFFGTNLSIRAAVPEKETADLLARRFARMGFNSVRLHHFDRMIQAQPGMDGYFDEEALDRLFYLIHVLEQAGMYITIDLFSSRTYPESEVPDLGRPVRREMKALPIVSENARNAWKEYARRLLTRPNPYSGKTLAGDPALYSICLINEDPVLWHWNRYSEVAQLFQQAYQGSEQARAQEAGMDPQAAFTWFLIDRQNRAYADMMRFMREELGVRAILTGINQGENVATGLSRSLLDHVDNHSYWDHPRYTKGMQPPYAYLGGSVLEAGIDRPGIIFGTRLFGRPFAVTEFNFVYPNRYRAECGPVYGAYAALQDWGALYRYAYAHRENTALGNGPLIGFDTACDPVSTLADRIIALLFLRGDIEPGRNKYGYLVDPAQWKIKESPLLDAYFPEAFSKLGLVSQIGSAVPGVTDFSALNAVVHPPGENALAPGVAGIRNDADLRETLRARTGAGVYDPDAAHYASDTGQLELQGWQGWFSCVSDLSETFSFSRSGRLAGRSVTVDIPAGSATVCVASLDQHPVADSTRLLLLHLTDVQGSGITFGNKERTRLDAWGKQPLLARAGHGTVMIHRNPGSPALKAYALDTSGRRLFSVPLRIEDDRLVLETSVFRGGRVVFAYELTAKE